MNAPLSSTLQPSSFRPKPLGPEQTIKTEQIRVEGVNLMLSLKENVRGRFLRVSEKNGERFASLMIPAEGLKQFNDLLSDLVRFSEKSGRITVDRKDFTLVMDHDGCGVFLNILEECKGHVECITVPGSGLNAFAKLMDSMAATSELEPFPFNPVRELQPTVSVQEKVIKSTIVQVETKSFKLTLKDNPRGRWLRITEKAGQRFTCLYVPALGFEQFTKMLQLTIEVSNQILCPVDSGLAQSSVNDQTLSSQQIQINEKMFDFVIHQNIRGRYLRLIETTPGFYPKHLIIPSTGLEILVRQMEEMIAASDECPLEDFQGE
jgi:hypothetical protein